MRMHSFRSVALGAALLLTAGVASAGVINFSSQGLTDNTVLSNPTVFSGGTGLVAAFALVPGGPGVWTQSSCTGSAYTGTDPCLYYKNGGTASETGLGLTGGTSGNNEIFNPNGIGFLTNSGYISGFELGSVQAGESWQVLGCDQNGCGNVLDAGIGGSGNDTVTITGLGAYYYGYVVTVPCADGVNTCNPWALGGLGGTGTTDGNNNILIMSLTTVPEPGTLALLAAGLAAIGFAVTRRRKLRANG